MVPSEMDRPALARILDELVQVPYVDSLVISLNRATLGDYDRALDYFAPYPGRKVIVWSEAPAVQEFLREMEAAGLYGKGAVSCRMEGGEGAWGPPLMISVGGGSFGIQIGGQAADFVFLVMNPRRIEYLLKSQFTLGADASVAAGAVGRRGEAATDLRLRAEILSYSRTRGLFAGLSLEGAVVKQDEDANRTVYGETVSPKELLVFWGQPMPDAARGFVGLLQEASPRRVAAGD